MQHNLEHSEQCPQCIGAKEIMVPKETKGFKYINCNLCNGKGLVQSQIADDFIFAMTEDNFESEEY
jgi:hypothetical protein